jgi:hypothetical protein
MTAVPTNPKVEKIRQSIHKSYEELNQLIDGPLAVLEQKKLYESPTENEWTIMQNLAHTVEFLSYWANEIKKLVAEPGRNFGRIATDEGRLRSIEQHSRDNLEQVKAALPGSYTRLEDVLGSLRDSDLEITGRHVKYGEQTLEWFIEEFVTKHLSDHVAQIRECVTALK